MAQKIARTQNLTRLELAYKRCTKREANEHGLMLVHGAPGLGKTTGVGKLFVEQRGILLTCLPGITQKFVLTQILRELRREPKGSNGDMILDCLDALNVTQKPIFVDEADFLFSDYRNLETLRTLHDSTGVVVVLVGMSSLAGHKGIDARIRRFPQFADRILEWVEFTPASISDCGAMAETLCSAPVEEELLEVLRQKTHGNFRRLRMGLSELEREIKANGLTSIGLSQWGNRSFVFEEGSK